MRALFLVLALISFAFPAFGQDAASVAQVLPDGVTAEIIDTANTPVTLDVRIIQLFLLVTVLSLAPGIAMMVTCLPLLVIVFSFLRQALGLQQTPPNSMIMGLAMILTFFIMEPVFMESWANGVSPYMDGLIEADVAFAQAIAPFREFMELRVDRDVMVRLADALPGRELPEEGPVPLGLLTASFMLSEIKTAFQIGFAIFLPFLAIDLVVASVLMGMGMMMVPPAVVSLPFKIGFFVLADGWLKITEALLLSYAGVF
jgi:flagellar biosynthetic protein FliP